MPTYWVLVCGGLIAALLIFRFLSIRFRLSDKAFLTHGVLLVVSIFCGFVSSWAFQRLYDFILGKEFDKNGGITFLGGLVGGVAVFILLSFIFCKGQTRRELWNTICLAPLSITVAHSFGRLGCFSAGCCFGRQTHSFLDVTFKNDITGLPTQLFESVFLILLFAVLLLLVFKYKKYSLTMIVYLFSYSIFRFTIEFWRGDEARGKLGALWFSQWQSLIMFMCAALLTVYIFVLKRIPFNGRQTTTKLSEYLFVPAAEKSPHRTLDDTIGIGETK